MPHQPFDRAARLASLYRQIEDCAYLLTRPATPAEHAMFMGLLDACTRQVRLLEFDPRGDAAWRGARARHAPQVRPSVHA